MYISYSNWLCSVFFQKVKFILCIFFVARSANKWFWHFQFSVGLRVILSVWKTISFKFLQIFLSQEIVCLKWNGKSDGIIVMCRMKENFLLKAPKSFQKTIISEKIPYNTREMISETSMKIVMTFRCRNVDDYSMKSYKNISLLVNKWWTVRELAVNRLVFYRSYSCFSSGDFAKMNIYIVHTPARINRISTWQYNYFD